MSGGRPRLGTFKDRDDILVSIHNISSFAALGSSIPCTYAVAIINTDEGVILVRNRFHHRWELPGGFIGKDESSLACVAREVYEESGIEANDLSLMGAVLVNPPLSKGRRSEEFGLVYAGTWYGVLGAYSSNETTAVKVFCSRTLPADIASIDAQIIRSFTKEHAA